MGSWNAAEMFLEEIKKVSKSTGHVKEIYVEFFGSWQKLE